MIVIQDEIKDAQEMIKQGLFYEAFELLRSLEDYASITELEYIKTCTAALLAHL